MPFVFTKQQAWLWSLGTRERSVCASQPAEHKKRSMYHENIQSDGEVSFSQMKYQCLSFTWWKGAKFLLWGVGPRPEGCDGSHTEQVGCVWLQVSQSDIRLKKVLHCVTCLLSLQEPNRTEKQTHAEQEDTFNPLGERGKSKSGRPCLLKEHDFILH